MVWRSLLENSLLISGEVTLLYASIVQTIRIVKTRDVGGLSAITYTLYAAGNIAWIAYFISLGLYVPVATNAFNFVLTVLSLGYVLMNRQQFKRGVYTIMVVGPLTGYILIVNSLFAGWIGAAYGLCAATPYLYKVLRYKRVSGISLQALYTGAVSMMLVLVYAVLVHAPALIAACVQGLLYELIILRYWYRYRVHNSSAQ